MTTFLRPAVVLATLTSLASSALALDWPQWRGPDRTGVAQETGLLKSWPAGGPKRVWMFENAGKGYSGPAIAGGKYFTIGTRDDAEVLLILDANTGKELRVVKIGEVLENKWGDGPRGTPTVDGDRVYALSGPGDLACISIADGKVLWKVSMSSLGGKTPNWGYTESVLVDGNKVLCTPGGGKGTVAALDKLTGKVLWQSGDIKEPAHYSSIVPATINGTPQYVQRNEKSIFGLAAKDGRLLWQTDFPGRTAMIPTPIVSGNEVYVTAGYGTGCKMVRIEADNKVTVVYENKVAKNHHGGFVKIGDYLYGHGDPQWVCQNFKTGEEVWSSRALGKGAVGAADGMLYCLDENTGTVALVEASPKGWNEISRFKLDPQTKIRSSSGKVWTHPVIANGKLYLRDQDLIYCYDVKQP
ncbi:MAG: PQQ-binding-like beta-propeller repeat protein [Opitutaceae bacterium]|nr:PQQ-binding-like beta-propeller repeat protein [Opitutaceae bacterium]